MARITAQQKAIKKQIMDDFIYDLFCSEGWDAVTYDRIARDLNMGKSSVQRYYESKIQFATALQGRLFPIVVTKIDFSCSEAFITSWLKAYHDSESIVFREIVRMLMTNVINLGTSKHTRSAVLRLQNLLATNTSKEEAEQTIKFILGETCYLYMNQ